MADVQQTMPGIARGAGVVALSFLLLGCGGGSGATPEPTTAPTSTAATAALSNLTVVAKIDVPGAFEIAQAFDSIWVGSNTEGTVTRIDPATNTVVATIRVSSFVSGLAPTADGIWVIDGDARAVRRIDPASNKLSSDLITIGDDGGNLQFADGKLWQSGRGHVVVIDPVAKTTTTFDLPCTDCGAAIFGGAGYATDGATISRIDLTTQKVTATNATDTAGGVIGFGPQGLWAGSSTASVALLDPVTLKLLRAVASTSAVAADGSTWALGAARDNGAIIADDAGAWVRFSAPVLGRVSTEAGTVTMYGPFPPAWTGSSSFVVTSDAIWITNVGGAAGSTETGSVWRLALPAA